MRYTKKINLEDLTENYDVMVGWGVGEEEFCKQYNPFLYKLDYMIDKNVCLQGQTFNGIVVSNPKVLSELKGKKVCIIIFPNLENEIIQNALEYLDEFDTIVSRLLYIDNNPLGHFYSTEREDIIIDYIIDRLNIKNPLYVDIGVCHPVIRNNTYLMYEKGYHDGVLVEPNLEMCELAKIYRPQNEIVSAGACAGIGTNMRYYMHPNPSYRGHNTFDQEIAREEGSINNYVDVPVVNINEIIRQKCDRVPDILDIDTEGLDYELIDALDTNSYPIKIICSEIWKKKELFASMMEKKGYVQFASTKANNIYIKQELLDRSIN